MGQVFKLGSVANGDALASGLFAGMKNVEAPLWSDGVNIIFKEGVIEKIPGKLSAAVFGATVTGIGQARVSGVNRIYAGTASTIQMWDGVSVTTIGTGFTSGDWVLTPWGNWLIATNNVDFPQIWKNTGTMAALGGVTFSKCKLLEKIGPFLIALNTSTNDRNITWCNENDPESWTIVDAGDAAGSLPINEFSGEIVSSCKLGDNVICFSREELAVIRYIGGVGVFGYKFLPAGGACARKAAVSVDNLAYVMSRHSVYVTDGLSTRNIDDASIRQWLQDNVDWNNISQLRSAHDEMLQTVKWYVPTLSGVTYAVTFNYAKGAWSKENTQVTSADEKSVFDYPLVSVGSTVYYNNNGLDQTTAWNLTSKAFDFGYQDYWKWVDMLRVIAWGDDITLEVAFTETATETPVFESFGSINGHNALQREGVFITFRFSGTGHFRISELEVMGQLGGRTL